MTYQRLKEMVEGIDFCCTRIWNVQKAESQLEVLVLRASWDIYKMSNNPTPSTFCLVLLI